MLSSSSNGEDQEARDWSQLSIDLLELILGLLSIVDHLRFGWVCRSWRSARLSLRASCRALQKPRVPMLLRDNWWYTHRHRPFLDPSDGRSYTLTLIELYGHLCVGSFGSWLIMVPSCQRYCYLYNPFTVTKYKLPNGYWMNTFSPLAVSSEPFAQDFAMLIVDGIQGYLCCIRAGEQKWSFHKYDWGNDSVIDQVVAVKGKFYALTSSGRLAHIEFDRNPILVWGDETQRVQFDRGVEHARMVESDGELLVVILRCRLRSLQLENAQPEITPQPLRIFKLDATSSMWIDAEDMMRDRMLFIGGRGSMCLKVGGGKQQIEDGGKLYTTDDATVGVFDLNTSSGSLLCSHDRLTGIWVSPELLYRDRSPNRWMLLLPDMDVSLVMAFTIVTLTAILLLQFLWGS